MTAPSEAAALRHPEKANNPVQPAPRKPDWLRVKAPMSREYQETRDLMRRLNLHTVCQGAARRLQPQSRDRAAALSAGAAGRALLRVDAVARAREAVGSGDVHEIRHHGRSR